MLAYLKTIICGDVIGRLCSHVHALCHIFITENASRLQLTCSKVMNQHVFLMPLASLVFRSFMSISILSLFLKLGVSAPVIDHTVRVIGWSYDRGWCSILTFHIPMFVEWILSLEAVKLTWRLQANVRRLINIDQIAHLLPILNWPLVLNLGKLPFASSIITGSLCLPLTVKELLILFHGRFIYIDEFVL